MIERTNRTLMDITRTILVDTYLNKSVWHLAVIHAAKLYNITPNKRSNGKYPYELFHQRHVPQSIYKKLLPFGSLVYVHAPVEKRTKLDDKAISTMWVGLSSSMEFEMCLTLEPSSWNPISTQHSSDSGVFVPVSTLLNLESSDPANMILHQFPTTKIIHLHSETWKQREMSLHTHMKLQVQREDQSHWNLYV